jgi:hypothetical protein
MAISSMRGGAGAGRGDNPHYQGNKVNAFSAKTRNAEPTKDDGSKGSKASWDVKNNATSPAGETMGQVKKTYKDSRKAGMSPDQSRLQAVVGAGNNYSMKTDHDGKAW